MEYETCERLKYFISCIFFDIYSDQLSLLGKCYIALKSFTWDNWKTNGFVAITRNIKATPKDKKWVCIYLRYCCRRKCAMIFSRSSRGSLGGTTPGTLNFAAPFPIHESISFKGVSFSFRSSACFRILIRSLQ